MLFNDGINEMIGDQICRRATEAGNALAPDVVVVVFLQCVGVVAAVEAGTIVAVNVLDHGQSNTVVVAFVAAVVDVMNF